MTDPLAFILWHLLGQQSSVTIEDVYEFDSGRVEAVLLAAHMVLNGGGYWLPSEDTAMWYQRTWDRLRGGRPSSFPSTTFKRPRKLHSKKLSHDEWMARRANTQGVAS